MNPVQALRETPLHQNGAYQTFISQIFLFINAAQTLRFRQKSGIFLASQDALEVMRVTELLTELLTGR